MIVGVLLPQLALIYVGCRLWFKSQSLFIYFLFLQLNLNSSEAETNFVVVFTVIYPCLHTSNLFSVEKKENISFMKGSRKCLLNEWVHAEMKR